MYIASGGAPDLAYSEGETSRLRPTWRANAYRQLPYGTLSPMIQISVLIVYPVICVDEIQVIRRVSIRVRVLWAIVVVTHSGKRFDMVRVVLPGRRQTKAVVPIHVVITSVKRAA